jgi:hypothetical protein
MTLNTHQGGDKYVVCGILVPNNDKLSTCVYSHCLQFKFCLDTHGLYGGVENAMKVASHEVRVVVPTWITFV